MDDRGFVFYNATTTAFWFGGFSVTSVFTWDDVKAQKRSWDTIVWVFCFGQMASSLKEIGFFCFFRV
ncbi:anion permease [Flavobacterium procerum]|uniref:anion permease n=1 Tax=Flavobacterium procerum TaxID=1455569 RepID=UPI0035EE6EB9